MPKFFILLGSAFLAACGQTDNSDLADLNCGLALTVESTIAELNDFDELVGQLKPVIRWYTLRAAQLPPQERTKRRVLDLGSRYKEDASLRKSTAKKCVTRAYEDPVFAKMMGY